MPEPFTIMRIYINNSTSKSWKKFNNSRNNFSGETSIDEEAENSEIAEISEVSLLMYQEGTECDGKNEAEEKFPDS